MEMDGHGISYPGLDPCPLSVFTAKPIAKINPSPTSVRLDPEGMVYIMSSAMSDILVLILILLVIGTNYDTLVNNIQLISLIILINDTLVNVLNIDTIDY